MSEKDAAPAVTMASAPEEKVALFRSLFRGREDVFARRFESRKSGKSGYQPMCGNEWIRGVCEKPKVRCASCPQRAFVPVSDRVAFWHLRGKDDAGKPFAMGIYPMLADETVRFAAVDFDKASWKDDVASVRDVVREAGFPAAVERSRSGNGAHLWFFFADAVPARDARDFVSRFLAIALDRNPGIGLDSYDRIFPNQNTMPKGGFGNLIALPLQREPRLSGNSVFVDDAFEPHPDQWAVLSSLVRIDPVRVAEGAAAARAEHRELLVPVSPTATSAGDADRPWSLFSPVWTVAPADGALRRTRAAPDSSADIRGTVEVVLGNRVYVDATNLPAPLLGRLVRLASFSNPAFFEAERMRLSVHGIPRVISCAQRGERFLALPRGCREAALRALAAAGFAAGERDERYGGVPLDVSFRGELRPAQRAAVDDLRRHDTGVLAAGTAFGKTVVAAWMIAERKTNVLVLVNRRELQMQWVERLASFLGVPASRIGRIGGGARRRTGEIDVALVQSLSRKGEVDPLVREYGHVVVDECHAISAPAFERVLDGTSARYVLGLSATVVRKDGHHPIVFMQCGPVRHRVDARASGAEHPFAHYVVVRPTPFRPRFDGPAATAAADGPAYTALCAELAADDARNHLIATDALGAVEEGRSPVVLTERREHLETLRTLLEGKVRHLVALRGGMRRREAADARARLASIPDGEPRILLATGSYLGEGFDDARLDTLLLAMPISWKGRVTQYAGRLHRLHAGKTEVRVYDYLDSNVALFGRMFDRRCRGYEALGYKVLLPPGAADGWPADIPLPVEPAWRETYSESVRRLCRDGVDAALADLFVWASLRTRDAPGPPPREAAIRFLAQRLETLPRTAGRFRARVRLPIPFETNPDLEVDLFSEEDRLAVELDEESGLSDPDAYRRARRKDLLLQEAGHSVIRFLASDVLARLPAVLDALIGFLDRRPRPAS